MLIVNTANYGKWYLDWDLNNSAQENIAWIRLFKDHALKEDSIADLLVVLRTIGYNTVKLRELVPNFEVRLVK